MNLAEGEWGNPANRDRQTCGPPYKQVLELFTGLTTDPIQLFAAGFMAGEAEKIYLGACKAAMFRPSLEHRPWLLQVAVHLSVVYQLEVSVFERDEISDGVWIHDPGVTEQLSRLRYLEHNSWQWHTLRGRLCGVAEHEIDHRFHERKGFGEPCDNITRGLSAQTKP